MKTGWLASWPHPLKDWSLRDSRGGSLVALNLIGGAGLVYWIREWIKALQGNVKALEGTIATHEAQLKSMGDVNRGLLEVFRTLDPQRWAAEVEVHKKLADERAAAMIERGRRELERELETRGETMRNSLGDAYVLMGRHVRLALQFLPYAPKKVRLRAIEELRGLDPALGQQWLQWANETPEVPSAGLSLLDVITSNAAAANAYLSGAPGRSITSPGVMPSPASSGIQEPPRK